MGFGSIKLGIVDDSRHLRESLKTALEAVGGFEVVCMAESEMEVLTLSETIPLEVILLDLELPKGGAFRAAKAIKDINPNVAIIGLCVFSSSNLERAAREAGIGTTLEKALPVRAIAAEILKVRRRQDDVCGQPSGGGGGNRVK